MVFLLILVLTFAAQYFLEWWYMAFVCYVVSAVFGKTAWGVFFSGFFAVFFVWAGMAFWADIRNDQILSSRIGQMLGLPESLKEWLFVITALIGGIVGCFSAISGYYTKRVFIKKTLKTPLSKYQ
jgi:hypothetical protein